MGILDTILGRTKPVRANLDALFALPSAAITLQSAAGLLSSGMAGICWKAPAGQSVEDVQREIAELLQIPEDPADASDQPTAAASPAGGGAGGVAGAMTQAEDAYGYRWLLLEDAAIEELVTRVHLVNSTLTDNGWGPQLLCSVFRFVPGPEAAAGQKGLFLVYLYKRGTFYPFAPDRKEHRDTELELRMRAVLGQTCQSSRTSRDGSRCGTCRCDDPPVRGARALVGGSGLTPRSTPKRHRRVARRRRYTPTWGCAPHRRPPDEGKRP